MTDPAVPGREGWLRIDQYADTEQSLRKAAELVSAVDADTGEWKWLLISLHSALQGMFVLVLSIGGSLGTLKKSHANDWLRAYETGGPWPKKVDLDFFLELYEKAAHELQALDSAADVATSPEQDAAMRQLNDLRNGFLHFGPQGLSIELAGLPGVCLRCVDVADQLGFASGLVRWPSEDQGARAQRSLKVLRGGLRQLEASFASKASAD